MASVIQRMSPETKMASIEVSACVWRKSMSITQLKRTNANIASGPPAMAIHFSKVDFCIFGSFSMR